MGLAQEGLCIQAKIVSLVEKAFAEKILISEEKSRFWIGEK